MLKVCFGAGMDGGIGNVCCHHYYESFSTLSTGYRFNGTKAFPDESFLLIDQFPRSLLNDILEFVLPTVPELICQLV